MPEHASEVPTAEQRALQACMLALAPAAAAVGGVGPLGAAAMGLCMLSVALLGRPEGRPGRAAASLGLLVAALGGVLTHRAHPAVGLSILLWAGVLGLRAWPGQHPSEPPRPPHGSAAFAAGGTIGLAWLIGLGVQTAELVLLALSAIIPATLAPRGVRPALALALPILVLLAHLSDTLPEPGAALLAPGLLLLLTDSSEQPSARLDRLRGAVAFVLVSPARLLVLSFTALCMTGTVLLSLPFSDTGGAGHNLLDAAFTAVSAACVTGLAVLDTPSDLTLFGQVVVVGLIQVGGLGIMTFAAAALLGAGRRLTLREEAAAADLLGAEARADLQGALLRVFMVTLLTEGIGALLLAPLLWMSGDGLLQGAWRAIFTSISAFCNAGFALQSDSLMGYQGQPLILLVISAVITVGSLGPPAVVALPMLWRRRRRGSRHLSIETRLIYLSTLLLLVLPAAAFLALEWSNTLAGMSLTDRLTNAWFQSVTLRTAGFNSVDLAAVTPATLVLMIVVMFVGGSPGSTAGGVKTTTMAVLLLAVVAAARGRSAALFAGRRVTHRVIYKATALTTAAVFSTAAALFALLLTQGMPLEVALFEATSALATVGLTVGGTAALDDVGKIIIILCMLAGRVGPLTLFIFLTERHHEPLVEYPSEDVAVG